MGSLYSTSDGQKRRLLCTLCKARFTISHTREAANSVWRADRVIAARTGGWPSPYSHNLAKPRNIFQLCKAEPAGCTSKVRGPRTARSHALVPQTAVRSQLKYRQVERVPSLSRLASAGRGGSACGLERQSGCDSASEQSRGAAAGSEPADAPQPIASMRRERMLRPVTGRSA
jgi:hypothetical protein